MLTKGYITDLPKFNNKYKVRIPVFETAGIGNTKSVFNASVIEATLVYTPGIIDNISIGDCVVIGFENDKQSKPIILGKLYCDRNLDKDLITKYTSEEEFNKFVEEVDFEVTNLQKDVLKLKHIVEPTKVIDDITLNGVSVISHNEAALTTSNGIVSNGSNIKLSLDNAASIKPKELSIEEQSNTHIFLSDSNGNVEKTSLSDLYYDVAKVSQLPTKTSDLTNDSGFITDAYHDSTKEDISNKVTSISSSSTDTQYPSAKCVYDNIENVREVAEGLKQTYVVSDATNPTFNSQDNTVELQSFITNDGITITVDDLEIGDTVYVLQTDVPDRWISGKKSNAVIQLCNKTSPSGTNKWYTSTNASNNLWTTSADTANNLVTFTRKSTSTSNNWQLGSFNMGVTVDSTHVYLSRWYVENNLGLAGTLGGSGNTSGSFIDGYTGYVYLLATGKVLQDSYFYFFSSGTISQDATIKIGKPQCFDLTQMYGAGNEPTTVEEFVADYPNDYYPYNITPGTQVAQLSKLETAKVPITSISVNGTNVPPILSNVDITVPTATSDLTNDSGFVTADEAHTYTVENTSYKISFRVVSGQPQLVSEEIV